MSVYNRPIRCLILIVVFALLFYPPGVPLKVLLLAGAVVVITLFEAKSLTPLGLTRVALRPTIAWAFGLAAVILVVSQVVEQLLDQLFGLQTDLSGYGALAGNAVLALQLLAFALASAAIGEELLFRGFLLHQLEAIVGEGKLRRWAIIIVAGIVFGSAHYMQGPTGIVITGVTGMIFGWAWFRSDRNLWAMMLAHGLIDTFGIGLIYFGFYS